MAIIPDWTLFIQIVNFIVLILILNAILYKPIRKILLERRAKIDGLEQAIESSRQEASDRDQALKIKMSDAKMKGHQEKEALKEAALAEQRRMLDEINEKAQQDLQAVRAQIAKDAEQARKALQGEIQGFSAAIAEKILGRAVS